MVWRSTDEDWGAVAKFLHWAMALCILIMIVMGITMKWLLVGNPGLQHQAYQLHKSFGFTLFLFALARLLWRLSAKTRPAAPAAAKLHERWLANLVHTALYVAMIGMPISGMLATSASPRNIPTVIFGVLTFPRMIGPNAALATLFSGVHFWLAILLVGSVSLHVAGAIRHAVVLRDGVLERMAPASRRAGPKSAPASLP
jgi:cytochrome b561